MKTTSYVALCAEYDERKKALDLSLRARDRFFRKAASSFGLRRWVWAGCAAAASVAVRRRGQRLDKIACQKISYWGYRLSKGA